MIEVLQIIATSWPIALMVVVSVAGYVLNRRWKQYQDDRAAIYHLNAKNAVVVRHARGDEG